MHIHVKKLVYIRAKSYARSLGISMAALVEQALQKLLGLEGLPLADEEIYGVAEPVPPKNGPGSQTVFAVGARIFEPKIK